MKNKLEKYYEKFDEEKRLLHRHGKVEFLTSMKYILKYLKKDDKVADIGAGTGAYSLPLFENGFDVTAVELVPTNLEKLRSKHSGVKTFLGDARQLSMLKNDYFDAVILFGPLYHLLNDDDKIKALLEAKRIVKKGGYIFVSYYMNEYAVLNYGFLDNNIFESEKAGRVDKNFHIIAKNDDIFSFSRLSDINRYKKIAGLKREKIFASDGASDYMRDALNGMDEKTFDEFLKFNFAICEKKELLGASSHVVDILKKV